MNHAVTITPEELRQAEQASAELQRRMAGRCNTHGAGPLAITTDDEVGGFAAEIAAAKALGLKWHGGPKPRGADIGERTQVRAITRPRSRRLLIREHDVTKYGNVPWVLVRRLDPLTYQLVGWTTTWEAVRVGNYTTAGHDDRPPIYLVEPERLRPITTFTEDVGGEE